MTNKLFTVAGTSNLNGSVKYRFATSMNRAAVLKKCGHTDIKLVELPNPMSKEDAVAFLATQGFDAAPTTKAVIKPKAVKTPKTKAKAA